MAIEVLLWRCNYQESQLEKALNTARSEAERFRTSLGIPYTTIVKGDSKVFSIAAASVLAKTWRDELMSAYSNEWPEYGFDRHVGYGTAEHVQAIMHYGRCPIHRKSFKLRQLGEK